MTAVTEKISPSAKLYDAAALLQHQLQGPAFLQACRAKALESFSRQGLPLRKSEEYKYSPVTRLFQQEPELPVFSEPAPASLRAIDSLDAHILRLVNGIAETHRSDLETGTSVWNLRTLPASQYAFFEKQFGAYALPDSDPFIALNTASFQDVLFIRIADNTTLKKPILIQNITETRCVTNPRILIHAGKNASVEIIEQYISSGKDVQAVNNSVSEIVVETGSRVLFYKLQNDCPKLQLISTTQVYQQASSHFDTHTVTFSGTWIRNNLNIVPDGEQCETHLNGLFILNEDQHTDNHTLVDHRKPNCESYQLYRGILKDKSTAVFNGKIFVRPDAQKTNAYQSSKNMLLSDEASMYTKPQLEIYADDVKCSHGSSTGQIDQEALFYLRARGLSEDSGRILLMQAFAKDVVNTVRIEALRNEVEQRIEKRLAL
ncbi:MAG TPA: Fe-S cluster assembly protein SufD [Bacteroidia bacterium]|jgi:Fe-S cluster assembly protein SufD|nr:Fe-S cluster assembly protein SufD [Bacteroidia bacterium]